jgi:hypothetical protein
MTGRWTGLLSFWNSDRRMPRPIAQLDLDLLDSDEKVFARVFAPKLDSQSSNWFCVFEIGQPINVRQKVFGASSFQAMILSLRTMAAYLYGSEVYRRGELGIYGHFGGDLSIPAPAEFLETAPYPF